jgi:hypothetical protein
MHFLLSPWFIGLSIASFLVMAVELWGLLRACKRHNASPIGILCGKDECLPTSGVIITAIVYILLTMLYVILPSMFHGYFA